MNNWKSKLLSIAPVVALAFGATACGSDDDADTKTGSKQLEIFSWLTAGSEKNSLDKLLDVVRTRVPGIEITNASQADPEKARDLLAKRMADNLPPDSFQLISGADIKEWIKKGALEPIDTIADQEGWKNGVFPQAVLDSASKDGKLYGVPLNTERDNTLFYNADVLAAAGITPDQAPKTAAEFFVVAEKLKAAGKTALAVPAKAGWTIASMVFEAVLVAEAGPTFYQSYLQGQEKADAPQMKSTLETVAKMLDYSADSRGTATWTDGVQAVCNGDAAMLILPDFVKGEFASRCNTKPINYVPMQHADTPTFVFVGIIFPLAVGAPNRSMAVEFLKTVGSKEGQEAFNPTKGSVGVRNDLSEAKFDAISAATLKDFKEADALVPAYAALTSSAFQEQVNPALQKFCDPGAAEHKDVNAMLATLRQAYSTLTP